MKRVSLLEKTILVLLLVVFGGIVLQAPLSVGFGTLFPAYDLVIKSWAEIILALVGILLAGVLVRRGKLVLVKDPVIYLSAGYILLHLLLVPLHFQGVTAAIAGLLIDLRYVGFFVLAYLFLRLHPEYKRQFLVVFLAASLLVVVFAVLQVFILPADFLRILGYGKSTIEPYLTVDQNHSYIRINSTLRGPNPLGAYVIIVLSFIAAALLKRRVPKRAWPRVLTAVLSIGGTIAVWASYSRSAVIGLLVALLVLALATVFRVASRRVWLVTGAVIAVLAVIAVAAWHTPLVSQVVLHEDPSRANLVNSNDGHVASLESGFTQMLHEPLGAGIGSTGSASLYGRKPFIIENHYLFVAHESGWIGLVLFLVLFGLIVWRLWRGRRSPLMLAACASGVGLAVVGLLLPVWADDTVSIVWWGLAAVALATWGSSQYNVTSEPLDTKTS